MITFEVPTQNQLFTVTSFELVTKTKPNLSQVWEFNTKIFVYSMDARKLESKVDETVFMGVDTQSKAY